MLHLTLCFLCLAILIVIAVMWKIGLMPFNHKPLAALIGIAAFYFFYKAMETGEIHNLSIRLARLIVNVVQSFL